MFPNEVVRLSSHVVIPPMITSVNSNNQEKIDNVRLIKTTQYTEAKHDSGKAKHSGIYRANATDSLPPIIFY